MPALEYYGIRRYQRVWVKVREGASACKFQHFQMPARCHRSACACIFPHFAMPARCLRGACATIYSTSTCERDACACNLHGVKVPAPINAHVLRCLRDACACKLQPNDVPARCLRLYFTADQGATEEPSLVIYSTRIWHLGASAYKSRHAKVSARSHGL